MCRCEFDLFVMHGGAFIGCQLGCADLRSAETTGVWVSIDAVTWKMTLAANNAVHTNESPLR